MRFAVSARWGILLLHEGRLDDAGGMLQDAVEHCERILENAEDFYDPLYVISLAQLALAHINPSEEQFEVVRAAYRRAVTVCPARGVLDSAAQDLDLLAAAVGETKLLRDARDQLGRLPAGPAGG